MLNEHDIEGILKKMRNMEPPQNSLLRAKNRVMAFVREGDTHRQPMLERSSIFHLLIPKLRFKYMIVALILALVLGGGGTVAAAQNDLPGDALYGVKLASERVAERLVRSEETKVALDAKFADRRADEIVALEVKADAAVKSGALQDAEKFEKHMDRTAEQLKARITHSQERLAALKAKDTESSLKASAKLESRIDLWESKLAAVESATSREELKAKLAEVRGKVKELRAAFEKVQDEAADENGAKGRDEQSATGRVGAAENKLAALTDRRARILVEVNASGDAEAKAKFDESDKLYQEAVTLVAQAKAALEAKDWKLAWDKANSAFKAMVQFHGPMLRARVNAEVKEETREKREEIKEEVKERLESVIPEIRVRAREDLKARLDEQKETE
ncbi:hypothetical protein A3F52_02460 [Candidatus Uhrbacteria bacterium RIFCSPHIGHO2_12_FULL_47_11]|nr:MAG: hypothetical protein A2753_02575 [Candidatus Uhrbacteria bacterium RIFCSPHIGHO2_01_FULL_47_11]OGL75262.1 MAG: hypothetical protein A3F52_02460 [Candidatus Uhrbacteria bacterium RIFCSPHIGHO2_12_FULL_47_11]